MLFCNKVKESLCCSAVTEKAMYIACGQTDCCLSVSQQRGIMGLTGKNLELDMAPCQHHGDDQNAC